MLEPMSEEKTRDDITDGDGGRVVQLQLLAIMLIQESTQGCHLLPLLFLLQIKETSSRIAVSMRLLPTPKSLRT